MNRTSPSVARKDYHQVPLMTNYVLMERLGAGSYATVYKAFKKKSHNHIVAVKCIDRKRLTKGSSTDNLLTEIAVMKELDHPHIVKLEDFEWNEKYIFLILEFCDGGDLSIFIKRKAVLEERVARKFLRQLAMALQFLREKQISHMDLKPQNLLLSGNSRHPVLKVAGLIGLCQTISMVNLQEAIIQGYKSIKIDFGMAQHLDSGDLSDKYRGSPLYMAPEIMHGLPYDSKVDLWSVGVILYETLFGEAPFASKTFEELEGKIMDSAPIEIPSTSSISSECKDLLENLLQRSSGERISFDNFFEHPFVDLQHIPGPQCLPRAKEIVIKAVSYDSEGNVNKALQYYTEAIEYFIPAMDWKDNQSIREELRTSVAQYITRAEELKQVIYERRPSICHPKAKSLLESLKSRNSKVKEAYTKISSAEKAEANSKFKLAFDQYKDAVELLFSIRLESIKQEESDLIKSEIQQYLNRAEEVQVLSRQKPRFGLLHSLSQSSESTESRCRIQ